MARDPPSLVSSSELRDLFPQPSDVRPARITVVHHQLRDLVLPLDRGHVLYPRGTSIEELRWSPVGDDEPGPSKGARSGTTRTFARLTFMPNCLTATGPIMACGGQGGELYMTNLPSRTSSTANLNARFPSSPPPIKPFFLSAVLPTMSINNSMIILPGWPGEWHRRERQRRAAFLRRHGPVDMDEESEDDAVEKIDEEENMDEAMDLDDIEDMFDAGPPGVATYPNTVPFVHPPRIPHLSPRTPSMEIPTARRASSFSDPTRPARPNRPSFSHSLDRPGLPPIQYVTSLPSGPSSMTSSTGARRPSEKSDRRVPDRQRGLGGLEEPRLLISNNDQTVKMFSLPLAKSLDPSARRASGSTALPGPYVRAQPFPMPVTSAMRRTVSGVDGGRVTPPGSQYIHLPRINAPIAPPPPRFGSSLGWDSIGANDGIQRNATQPLDSGELEREIRLARAQLQAERENRRRAREEFERVVGMGVGLGSGSTATNRQSPGAEDWRARPMTPGERGELEERKLAKVGGARFKCPVNHSSLSPDMKTMVSVGDSSEVYLLQVIDGGREFKRIRTYSAATDAGFSTSWSKDGRKFAVASQDGQVTVWDHRSSNPLAIFHTSQGPHPDPPSFTSDLSSSRRQTPGNSSDFEHDSPYQADRPNQVLIDPMTGEPQSLVNENGREAARVVKFSPEGSSRDLMVFSEEKTNIHIVDARTFNTHMVIPVPWRLPSSSSTERSGVEGGTTGIAGLAFDPSGDWLYAGTEKTVVEWDMRRVGGGESGTWRMA